MDRARKARLHIERAQELIGFGQLQFGGKRSSDVIRIYNDVEWLRKNHDEFMHEFSEKDEQICLDEKVPPGLRRFFDKCEDALVDRVILTMAKLIYKKDFKQLAQTMCSLGWMEARTPDQSNFARSNESKGRPPRGR